MIASYTFGRMVIGTQVYTSDLLLYPDGTINENWWRKDGHSLCIEDITKLIESSPRLIIAGTGVNGLMRPLQEVVTGLKEKGIEFRAAPTAEAVKIYNSFCGQQEKVGACFHLTC